MRLRGRPTGSEGPRRPRPEGARCGKLGGVKRFRSPVAVLLALSAVLALAPCPAAADVIHLASGDEIRGRIVEETPLEYVVEVPGGRTRIRKADVVEIDREKEGEYLARQGEDLQRLGAIDEALTYFRRALEKGDRRAAEKIADLQQTALRRARESGNLAEMERRVAEIRKIAPQTQRAKELGAAADAAAREVGAARQKARETASRGRAAVQKDAARALALFREAIRLDLGLAQELAPWLASATAGEGARLAREGEHARAAALFEEAIGHDARITPHVLEALSVCRVGVALERLRSGDPPAAIAALRAAVEADPPGRLARFYLGVALEVTGEAVLAEMQYRELCAQAGALAPGEPGMAPLRAAARAATGIRLPVDAETLLAQARFDRPAEGLAYQGERGAVKVLAPSAAIGEIVLGSAEAAAQEIARWAGPGARSTPVEITVLESQDRFREITGQPEGVLGLTLNQARGPSGERRIFTFAQARGLATSVVPHEMGHALAMASVRGAIPLWLNEGLAISCEETRWIQGRIAGYKASLEDGSAIPVEELIRMRSYPKQERIASFYDGAAALGSFLIGRGGREHALALAQRAAQGGLEPALSEVYGFQDLESATNAFATWLRDGGGAPPR